MGIGHWNHRVLAYVEEGEPYYVIGEVYYNEDGTIRGVVDEKNAVGSDMREGLEWVLDHMRRALDFPYLIKEGEKWVDSGKILEAKLKQ